jgi:hypothetical protein
MAKGEKTKASWLKRLAYLIMVMGGSGVGGYQLKDYPVINSILQFLTGDEQSANIVAEAARNKVVRLIDSESDTSRAGVYEVRIDEVKLDPRAFRPGQTIDIQVRVRSIDSSGIERIAWNSADVGMIKAVVGRDELTASWRNRPFQLGWSPGEGLIVEVVGKRFLRETVLFRTNPDSNSSFPLRSGRQNLVCLIDDAPASNPEASQVTLTAKRVGNRPTASPVMEQPLASGNRSSSARR